MYSGPGRTKLKKEGRKRSFDSVVLGIGKDGELVFKKTKRGSKIQGKEKVKGLKTAD